MERKLYPLDVGLMGALANAWARAILDGGAGFTEYFIAVCPAPQGRGVRNGAGVYAINVPFAKALLDDVPPVFLGGLLYVGAGQGVGFLYLFRFRGERKENRLSRGDLPFAAGMVALDIVAPILLRSRPLSGLFSRLPFWANASRCSSASPCW